MIITVVELIYGVAISVSDLLKTSYAPNVLKDAHEDFFDDAYCEFIGSGELAGMEVRDLNHKILDRYLKSKTLEQRLPFGKLDPTSNHFVVGIVVAKMSTEGSEAKDLIPDMNRILSVAEEFKAKVPKELFAIGGQQNIHMVADGCGCCS